MPLIINEDEGKVLGKKQAKVPDKLVNKIKNNLNLFGQYKKSKGYKRASSIVDDDYNKRSNKKDKINNGDKTLSFSDVKKIDHEFKNMSINDDDANEKNLGFILPGGNDMKNWAHDTLRKMRTAVKKVNAVPPVPKLEKNPAKVKDINKGVKMGNANVRLTEGHKKNIILTESQLLALKEYHTQTVFNFDKEGNPYFQKNNWQHYIDFLEDIGKPGTLPASTWDKSDILKAVEQALSEMDNILDDAPDTYELISAFKEILYDVFIYEQYDPTEIFEPEFLSLFEKDEFEEYKEKHRHYTKGNIIEGYLNSCGIFNNPDELTVYLTTQGSQAYDNELHQMFNDRLYEYDMMSGIIINDRGLMYVERNITIPKFDEPTADGRIFGRNYKDFYSLLKDNYSDLGTCFSWAEGGGAAYCGNCYGMNNTEIKLKCWIDPKDVNWKETVFRNCYALRYEQEVYIDKIGAKIEVFDVQLVEGNAELPIRDGGVNRINRKRASNVSILNKPLIITY